MLPSLRIAVAKAGLSKLNVDSEAFRAQPTRVGLGVEKSMRESITNKRESAVTGGVMLPSGF